MNEKSNQSFVAQFASNLKKMINEKGIKQVDVERGVGISYSTLYRYLHCEQTPGLDIVEEICKFMGCKLSD